MSHTPAPWNARAIPDDNDDLRFSHWVDSEDGTPLADVRSYDFAEANARLIAASPELLTVLESWYETRTTEDRLAWDKSARAAIAKAKGEG